MSQGFKRGSIVKHIKKGLCYVGGENVEKKLVSLHSIQTGKRFTQSAKPTDLTFKAYNTGANIFRGLKSHESLPSQLLKAEFPAYRVFL